MNRTKKIYFLAAFVMIIGCYALNKSYSLFVATEEQEAVTSKVPILESSISMPTITLSSNEECLIKQTINNTSEVPINYSLSSTGTNYEIKLVDDTTNTALGTVNASSTKDIYLYLKNTSSNENTITFNLNKKYTTLNNDLTSNITDTYTVKSYANPYAYNTELLSYNIINNYITSDNYTGTVPEDKTYTLNETKKLFGNNVKVSLPIKSTNTLTLPDPPTTPGKEISISTEKILAQTEDDYGTSYYYRGVIDNNFVNFAGMCWSIIRIQGDGSIKMILASELECSETNLSTTSGYATDGASGTQGNIIYDRGYSDSQLNSWLDRKITNNENITENEKTLIKQDNWCKGDLTSKYDYNTYELITETIATGTSYYYSAGKRLNQQMPTLICDGSKDKNGEIIENYIGSLTPDEVAYAGSKLGAGSIYKGYLNTNASSKTWWTAMDRYYYGNNNVIFKFTVRENGILDSIGTGSDIAIRPVISLTAITQISSGNGTISNPYNIKID